MFTLLVVELAQVDHMAGIVGLIVGPLFIIQRGIACRSGRDGLGVGPALVLCAGFVYGLDAAHIVEAAKKAVARK